MLICLELNLGIPETLWINVMTVKYSRCWWLYCGYLGKTVSEGKFITPNSGMGKVCMLLRQQLCPHEWPNLLCFFIVWARNQRVVWLTWGLISGKMGSVRIFPLDQKQPRWFDLCLLHSAGCPCKVLSLINMGRALAVEQLRKCRSLVWICRNPRGVW